MKHSICLGLIVAGVFVVWVSMAGAQDPGPQTQTGTRAALGTAASASLSTSFTYQGELRTAGGPVSGTCDFQFSLWNALSNGAQVGSTQPVNGVSIVNGRFAVQLDFGGSAFGGDARYLQIAVRCPAGSGNYATLAPRQPLTAAPYALSLRPGATISGTGSHPAYTAMTLRNDAGYGLHVLSAGWDGVRVDSASDNGVYVGKADNGVHVNYADFNGFSVYSATRAGVYVFSSGQDGIQVCTNIPGDGCATSGGHHGVELDNIDDDGVYVGRAGGNGLYVGSAITGVHVYSATKGLIVDSAGSDGVYVHQAGSPSWTTASDTSTGFEVAGAEGYGLWVGWTDRDGVFVNSASWSGVYVASAGGDGVRVASAGGDGMDATSTNASAYGGRFVNSAAGGPGLYALGGNNTAPDLVLGGNSSTSDDGRIRSDSTYTSSDILLISNDAVQINLDSNDDESGNLWVVNGAGTTVFSINENGDMTAIGTKNALVTTQDYGQRKLYAMESPQNWFEDFGSAQLVNGQATVPIEPIFAQTVNLTETYYVFLTPMGDCSLYVANKASTLFTVKAMAERTCSIAFDYRIVAKRLGYESLRLEPAAATQPGTN